MSHKHTNEMLGRPQGSVNKVLCLFNINADVSVQDQFRLAEDGPSLRVL